MVIEILIIIILTSFVQSFFGTGVLLFGTPLLLIFGYDFFTTLSILLPTSILISLSQIFKNFQFLNNELVRLTIVYSVPTIIFFLFLTSFISINTKFFLGLFLILISTKDSFLLLKNIFKYILKYKKLYFTIMGIVHGLTNSGGAMLSAVVFEKNISKISKRTSIAFCYLIFALFQIITLFFVYDLGSIVIEHLYMYWFIGQLIYVLSNKYLFMKVDEKKYSLLSRLFLFLVGIVLIIDHFNG